MVKQSQHRRGGAAAGRALGEATGCLSQAGAEGAGVPGGLEAWQTPPPPLRARRSLGRGAETEGGKQGFSSPALPLPPGASLWPDPPEPAAPGPWETVAGEAQPPGARRRARGAGEHRVCCWNREPWGPTRSEREEDLASIRCPEVLLNLYVNMH